MTADYDLVVIGDTPEGIHAALQAVQIPARVALVSQPFLGRMEEPENFYSPSFVQLTHPFLQLREIFPDFDSHPHWSPLQRWDFGVEQNLTQYASVSRLKALGVDFIGESGRFYQSPRLEFRTENRILHGRSYIIATGSRQKYPAMIGLGETGCLTPFELWQMKSLDSLPERIAIAGNTPMAIQLAQILQRLGKKITLLFDTPSLLPQADFDIASLLQVQLEAEGICLVPQSQVSQVRRIDGKKWILAGKQAWELDELILATATQGNTEGLNLSAVGVEVTTQGLKVKKTLQTTNPRIYAIGNVINGDSSPNLARQMARIAVKNALFLPIYKMEDHGIPQILFTDPPIASIGLNEQRARQLYGQDFQVLKMPFKFNLKAQILGETTGFCKLIIDRSDGIIGADIIGYQAEELIQIISLVINQKLPLGTLTNLSSLGTFAEIIAQTARQKPQKYHFHKKWLTSWLIWQRQRY